MIITLKGADFSANNIGNIHTRIITISSEVLNYNATKFLSLADGSLIQSDASHDYKKVSDYVEIPDGAVISRFASITTTGNAYCAFYDKDKNFISSYVPQETDTTLIGTWQCTTTPPTIPSGAKYIRIAFNTGLTDYTQEAIAHQESATLVFAA